MNGLIRNECYSCLRKVDVHFRCLSRAPVLCGFPLQTAIRIFTDGKLRKWSGMDAIGDFAHRKLIMNACWRKLNLGEFIAWSYLELNICCRSIWGTISTGHGYDLMFPRIVLLCNNRKANNSERQMQNRSSLSCRCTRVSSFRHIKLLYFLSNLINRL